MFILFTQTIALAFVMLFLLYMVHHIIYYYVMCSVFRARKITITILFFLFLYSSALYVQ